MIVSTTVTLSRSLVQPSWLEEQKPLVCEFYAVANRLGPNPTKLSMGEVTILDFASG